MGKHNTLSVILVLIVILMIAASTFAVISYVTGVITAAVNFVNSEQMGKLQACGITPPAELFKLQADIPSLVLPAIYVGLPGLMIILSILMFIAGHYYGSGMEGQSSSETTTTTSEPDEDSETGRRVEKTSTLKSSRKERE
ncbi:MAG TPA: hypothetical protein PLO51_04230 [Candidatus Micrarchaeota archaeon]|nr:hypothetical protein [Candidatus Micrarchaeota archaeon]